MDHERKSREAIRHYTLGRLSQIPAFLALASYTFGIVSGNYGLTYWLPQIVKGVATDIGLDKATGIPINALTGYLVAVPFAFAIVAMIWWSRHSDATQERVWHVAGPAIVAGLSLISCRLSDHPAPGGIALTVGAMGPMRHFHFLDPSTGFLTGSAAAGGSH